MTKSLRPKTWFNPCFESGDVSYRRHDGSGEGMAGLKSPTPSPVVTPTKEESRFAQRHGVKDASNDEISSAKDLVLSMLRIMRSNSFVWLLPPNAGWFVVFFSLWFFLLHCSRLMRVILLCLLFIVPVRGVLPLQCRHSEERGVYPRPKNWHNQCFE